MLADAVQVAAMSQRRLGTVLLVGAHTLHLRIVVGTLCKTVGHEHVQHVGIGESLAFVARHLAVLQHIASLQCLAFLRFELQCHRAGLGITQVHVNQQIVRRVEAHHAVNDGTGIVRRHRSDVTDVFSIDHQLHAGIFHAYEPVGRVYSVYRQFCCIHHHYLGHQGG